MVCSGQLSVSCLTNTYPIIGIYTASGVTLKTFCQELMRQENQKFLFGQDTEALTPTLLLVVNPQRAEVDCQQH